MMRPEASDEQEYLYLTTRGRKTGRAHQIEIWFTRRGRSYYLVAEHGLRAHWVQNLLVEPRVRWRVGTANLVGRARVVRAETAPALGDALHLRSDRAELTTSRAPHDQARAEVTTTRSGDLSREPGGNRELDAAAIDDREQGC